MQRTRLDLQTISDEMLANAGGGDAAKRPAELVAVLGGQDGHNGQVLGVAVSPDGKMLASAGADKTVRLWDLSMGKYLRTLRSHTGPVFSVVFSADNQSLA